MPQISKVLRSRDAWKHVAIECRYKLRESRKAKKRYQKKITELKLEIRELNQVFENKKNIPSSLNKR